MRFRLILAWYDFWVGLFYDRARRRLHVFPCPMVGLIIDFWERYDFIVWLSGIRYEEMETYSRWYARVCDDATFGWRQGSAYLRFSRPAMSRTAAIKSAIADAEFPLGVVASGISDD